MKVWFQLSHLFVNNKVEDLQQPNHIRSPSSPPQMEDFKWTRRYAKIFGLSVSGHRRPSSFQRILPSFPYLLTVLFFHVHSYLGGLLSIDFELTSSVIIFGSCSVMSFVSLHRNAGPLMEALQSVSHMLSPEDIKYLHSTDAVMNAVHTLVVQVIVIVGAFLVNWDGGLMRTTFTNLGIDPSNIPPAVLIISGAVCVYIYATYTCGIHGVTIIVYAMTAAVMRKMAVNTRRMIIGEGKRLSPEGIRRIRTHLRNLWQVKVRVDKRVSTFPLVWIIYIFSSMTIILARLISEWHTIQETSSYILLSITFATLGLVFLSALFPMIEKADTSIDECSEAVFDLLHPGNGSSLLAQSEIQSELFLLDFDLSHKSDTYWTIYGMARLNKTTFVSLLGALVSFTVMVLNIRTVVKS